MGQDNKNGNPAQAAERTFMQRFGRLAGGYWNGEERWKVRGLTAALIVLTVAQVVSPILMNLWSQKLFDSLEQRAMDRMPMLILALSGIILANMTVTTTHLVLKRRLQMGWRRWLVRRVLDEWMTKGRHFQVTYMPGEHDNPDGRISEDIRITAENAINLAHSLFYCILLLGSFTKILWSLSGETWIEWGDLSIYIPGHLVWVALLYAAVGTTVAMLLGRPLVRAVNSRQTCEANFRFGLVRVRENSEAIALLHGEPDERRRFTDLFTAVADAWRRQTNALAHIFLFSSGYSVLSTAFPVLVAAPRYIAGTITLGVLMQTAQAFQQMEAALSWPVDNLSTLAEWRASVERVLGLHEALQTLESEMAQPGGRRIQVGSGDGQVLAFRDLTVSTPLDEVVISGFSSEFALGEHVLISGDPGAAIRLFKVVAGLWPWGSGQVDLPNDDSGKSAIFFMPQRPYLPIGRLRSAVSYPAGPAAFGDGVLHAALERVGLEHLIPRLDATDSWEKVLTIAEQQRLGFARLLLHRPSWIFIQEATDALDPVGEADFMQMLQEEFSEATVLTVGHHSGLDAYHQRKLVLVRSSDGLVLITDRRRADRTQKSRTAPRFYDRVMGLLKKPDASPLTERRHEENRHEENRYEEKTSPGPEKSPPGA